MNQEHGNGSAILGKLSVKTPIKNTNRKPVSMDNFNDSLTSSGTENDPFVPNIRHNPKELGTANGTGHSTPLSKLKVSASFADKLPQKEVPSTILVPEVEQQDPSQSEKHRLCFLPKALAQSRKHPCFQRSPRQVLISLWLIPAIMWSK